MTKKIEFKYDVGTHLMGTTVLDFNLVHGKVKEITITELLKEVMYVLENGDNRVIVYEKDAIPFVEFTWLQLTTENEAYLEHKKLANEHQKRIKQLLNGEEFHEGKCPKCGEYSLCLEPHSYQDLMDSPGERTMFVCGECHKKLHDRGV